MDEIIEVEEPPATKPGETMTFERLEHISYWNEHEWFCDQNRYHVLLNAAGEEHAKTEFQLHWERCLMIGELGREVMRLKCLADKK